MYGGGKLLSNDAVYFDGVAWSLAEEIRAQGWGRWSLFVNASSHGHVAILAALYAVWGHDPSLVVPINAAIHAFGGILIYLLAIELTKDKPVGIYAGLIASTLFIVFPSALNWYGQVHKDGYAIAGTLLILLMWIKVINCPANNKQWLWIIIWNSIGIVLVGIVRPYGLTLMLAVTIGAMLITVFYSLVKYKVRDTIKPASFFVIAIMTLFAGIQVTENYSSQIRSDTHISSQTDWQWQYSDWVPHRLESYIATAAKIRAELIEYGQSVNARSEIDSSIKPRNITEVVGYLPRALQVASLAPFPTAWFSEMSMTRLLASVEMLVYYGCILGVFFLLRYNRSPAMWMSLYFSTAFLTILGFTVANIGTLYRVRYAYLFVILMLGVVGWITFLKRKGVLEKIKQSLRPHVDYSLSNRLPEKNMSSVRLKAVGSGIIVMALTFIGFIGFFYRDILMAHIFGLGGELDSFFVALLMPMTIVTIICIPLGVAFTPVFLAAREGSEKKEVQELISNVSTVVIVGEVVACTVLFFAVPYCLPMIATNVNDNLGRIHELTILALPILFFSGFLILGNAILNALGKFVVSSMAQLVVPIIAILSVVILGEQYGVQMAMLGMVVGQLINLLIVQLNISKYGYSLVPNYATWSFSLLADLKSQYLPLVASAFFVSVAVLVNTLLAMSLPEGAVSIFNLGNKVVLLITGLVGAAVSTVMLPYFSKLIAQDYVSAARRELSVFLLVVTFLSVPISVALFVWAPQIVGMLFTDGNFGAENLNMVAKVMQFAVIQVPFFACNILLLKFATATRHVQAILIVALLGLIINIGASLLFMNYMGVAGIALGASLALVMSTTFLVILLVRYRHVGLLDMVVLLLNWLLFITLLMSIHFSSAPGVVVTFAAYLILVMVYSQSLFSSFNPMKWAR
jgi:murein biosynthesis integral membrane protein MurJ